MARHRLPYADQRAFEGPAANVLVTGRHRRARGDPFDGSAGLVNWLIVVAWHEVQAERRRVARIEAGEIPEQLTNLDPAVIVEGHLELDTVADGLATLSPAEREALLLPLLDGGDGESDLPSVRMRRYRARQHLANVVARNPL